MFGPRTASRVPSFEVPSSLPSALSRICGPVSASGSSALHANQMPDPQARLETTGLLARPFQLAVSGLGRALARTTDAGGCCSSSPPRRNPYHPRTWNSMEYRPRSKCSLETLSFVGTPSSGSFPTSSDPLHGCANSSLPHRFDHQPALCEQKALHQKLKNRKQGTPPRGPRPSPSSLRRKCRGPWVGWERSKPPFVQRTGQRPIVTGLGLPITLVNN